MVYVQNLDDTANATIEKVGGKAANLAELMAEGFPVPPAFVVTTRAYEEHLVDLSGGIPKEGKAIRKALLKSTFSGKLEKEILAAHHSFQKSRKKPLVYAVRSSATAEDLPDASFAGQHESYYYVTENNLLKMIKSCWASLWTEAACSYRNSQGIDHLSVKMAVIVQEMILSEVSGITFTRDPVTGNESLLVIESSWGMGAAIVDGRVTPDQFTVHRESRAITRSKISDKRYMIPPSPDDPDQMRIIEVPETKRRAPTLPDNQIAQITEYALKAEAHFGCCQDIEWAFHRDSFYLLQSRPITSAGQIEETIPKGKFVLFKPLYENFTDPLLPLSIDLLDRTIDPITFIYGRAYSNIADLRPFIPLKLTDAQLANMSYLSGNAMERSALSLKKLPLFIFLFFLFYLSFGVFYSRTKKMPDDFMDSFRKRAKEAVNNDSIDAIGIIYELFFCPRFFEPVGNMVLLANTSAGRYWGLIWVIKFLFNRWLPHLPKEAPSIFTSGDNGILPTQMGRAITKMATTAGNNSKVKKIILETRASEVINRLESEPQAEPFLKALENFMALHGHRGLKEMEINSPRWEENPATVINMMKNYLHDPHCADKEREKEEKLHRKREQLLAEIKAGLQNKPLEKLTEIRWKLISFLGNQSRYFIKLRENSRYYHIMIFYSVRKKVLKKEADFLKKGKLKCKDDIFYLKWKELKALDSGKMSYEDVEDLIRRRRLEYIRLCKFTAPKTIGILSSAEEKTGHDRGNKVLNGQGAAPGIYQGRARVILDPSVNATLKAGEILVAPYTDPAWTPLFLTAGAAVVETGSYLSHAGTIAREYGMPCVVDVPDCTSFIRTGDLVTVDGTSGKVSWAPHEELKGRDHDANHN